MKSVNQERSLYSKTDVKVYLKPEYHPALKGTNLSHPDFVRKAKELFGDKHEKVSGLSKICSENSEDAQTWMHFSPLLSMSPQKRGDWLEAFLDESLKRKPKHDLIKMLQTAKLKFWRGKRAKPMYRPPPNLGYPEGNTEVDLTIFAEKTIIFVEAKYHSEIEVRTTHFPNRDQIIRDIDIGTYYAWNKGLGFYFILLTSSNCHKSRNLLKHYLDNPQEIIDHLPHRIDIPRRIEQVTDNLGLITWNQLKRTNQHI
jgi:hypothetical protein